jgi:16S rRNA (cytosine1402-N4)-methyltransferase
MNHKPDQHLPVLFDEVIAALDPAKSKRYIDATLGGGGHTAGLLEKGALVLGIDQDETAIRRVKEKIDAKNLTTVKANFATIATQAKNHGFDQVDGILFDLGVSSFQLDTADRGFSFQQTGPLDMRMDQSSPLTAETIVNQHFEDELFEILMTYAQEPKSRAIAKAIVANRPITTTTQLADIIWQVYRGKRGHLHPATRTFQALRIVVNQELSIIKPALMDAYQLIKPAGKLVVISFHEGEDRIVKRTFKQIQQTDTSSTPGRQPIVPTQSETTINPRARSAKLRILQKG